MNHAVVNEDPNAKIIRELRTEIETLKELLIHTADPQMLKVSNFRIFSDTLGAKDYTRS